MIKKYIYCIVLFAAMWSLSVFANKTPENLLLIKANLYELSMDNPDSESIQNLLATLSDDGRWPDINYQDTKKSGWEPCIHVERVLLMAQAYTHPKNRFYCDIQLKTGLVSALDFYLEREFRSPKNRWYNTIGMPKLIGPTLLLLEDMLTSEQIEKGLYMMDFEARYKAWKKKEHIQFWHGTGEASGQNRMWLIRIYLFKAVLRGQPEEVRRCLSLVGDEFALDRPMEHDTFSEGLQADFSFHQHGPQLYTGSYGHAFAGDSSYFLTLARNTPFEYSKEKENLIGRYFLDGVQWMIYKGTMDFGTMGRSITRPGMRDKGFNFLSACQRMTELDISHNKEMENFTARLSGDKGLPLSGHRHFWCSDFSVHRRADYYVSVKMNSTRTLGTETGNGEGLKNFYLADGCTYIFLTGNEYNDVFAVWDWTRVPGVTSEWTGTPPEMEDWGNRDGVHLGARGDTSFVGGVSDGRYGMSAMDYHKRSTSAHKAWFCFESEVVCLGCGVTSTSSNEVITSVNQCLSKGPVVTGRAGVDGPFWISHAGIGYVFPDEQQVQVEDKVQYGSWGSINERCSHETVSNKVFSLWVSHGKQPIGQSYSYIIVPNTSPEELGAYTLSPAVEILENRPEVQAVYNSSMEMLQAVFYESATIEFCNGGFVEVDRPCLLMLQKDLYGVKITVSNPYNEALDLTVKTDLKLTGPECVRDDGHGVTNIMFSLPSGKSAGQSQTVCLKTISLEGQKE